MFKLKLVPDIKNEVSRLEARFEGEIQAIFPEVVLTGLLRGSDDLVERYSFVVKDKHGRCIVYADAAVFAITNNGIEVYHIYHRKHAVLHSATEVTEYIG